MPSYYEALGFKKSPFFREALEPTSEDYKTFVGRNPDVKRFMLGLNPDSGVHLVTGKRGVGKTSFVNAMQFITSQNDPGTFLLNRFGISFYPEKMLPCYRKLQLENNDSVDKVLMRTISSIIFSAEQFMRENNIPVDLPALTNFIAVKKEFQALTNISIASAEQNLDSNTKFDLLRQLIDSVKVGLDRRGIFLSIDNLDIIDLAISTRLLNELRDYLFIPGVCTILMGPEGMYADLRSTEDGLRIIDRITGQEMLLEPLNENEVVDILNIRKDIFALDQSKLPEVPLEESYVRELYKLTGGQIRLLFKICESLTMDVLAQYPSVKVVKGSDAANYLKAVVDRELKLGSYSRKQIELLKGCLDSPMRPRQYQQLKLDSGVHFIRLADKLIQDDLLSKAEQGNAVYYEPTGLLRLARHVGLV